MSEFMKSSPGVEKAVMDATTWEPGKEVSFEGLRESLKAALVQDGRLARDSESLGYGVQFIGHPQTQGDPTLPAGGFKFEREFRYHPSSGRRPLMLRANSLEELNQLQTEIEKTV
jgi:hypothetical protein